MRGSKGNKVMPPVPSHYTSYCIYSFGKERWQKVRVLLLTESYKHLTIQPTNPT